MQFARINGVTLHFQTIGATDVRPLLVFVNALGTDFRIWRDVVVRLAGECAMLTYDKRGHGLSDVGEARYSLQRHVDDLAGLLDHLGASDAIVCGLSVGGQIAMGLYGSRPDLVRALILCDTAHKVGDAEFWNARIEAVVTEGIEAIADALLERWFALEFRRRDYPALAGYRNMLIRQPVAGYIGTCEVVRDTDLGVAAARIAAPTLCLVGDADISTPPALMATLARLIPGARCEIIKGAGHLPCVEQPVLLVDHMRAFLANFGTEVTPHVTH